MAGKNKQTKMRISRRVFVNITQENYQVITVNMTPRDLKLIEVLIEQKLYPNRSELIRFSVRQLLNEELKNMDKREKLERELLEKYYESKIIGEA